MVAYRQTYEIIRGIQEKAAEQCAPVIFGIKPSNLLIIDQCYAKALKSLVETTGLKVRCFEHRAEKQVWFMFREPLYRQLADSDNRSFMKQFGYTENMTMDEILAYAAKRFREYKRGEAGFSTRDGNFAGISLSVMSKDLLNIMAVIACAVDIGKYMRMKKRPVRHSVYMPE